MLFKNMLNEHLKSLLTNNGPLQLTPRVNRLSDLFLLPDVCVHVTEGYAHGKHPAELGDNVDGVGVVLDCEEELYCLECCSEHDADKVDVVEPFE